MEFQPFPPVPDWAHSLTSVGVTGTDGKTTTTRWIAAALASENHPVLSVTTVGVYLDDEPWGDLQSHDQFVAFADRARQLGCRFLAIETTSEALALGFARAWPIRVGVFTNLSHDHLDTHGTPEHYLASKAQLFVHLPAGGAAIINADDDMHELLGEVLPHGVSSLLYARRNPTKLSRVRADRVVVSWNGTRARLEIREASGTTWVDLMLPMIGEVYVENAMAALAAANHLGIPWIQGAEALARSLPIPGRFEVVHRKPHVVIDYAHTPHALQQTLRTARSLCAGTLTAVFGAGGNRDRAKRPAMGKAGALADRVILTSDNPRRESAAEIAVQIAQGLGETCDVRVELEREAAIRLAVCEAKPGDVVVVAGKGHETKQQVGEEVRWTNDAEVVRSLFA